MSMRDSAEIMRRLSLFLKDHPGWSVNVETTVTCEIIDEEGNVVKAAETLAEFNPIEETNKVTSIALESAGY